MKAENKGTGLFLFLATLTPSLTFDGVCFVV